MAEESYLRVSSDESLISNTDTSITSTRKRKRRKWDQPADVLVSAGFAVPGVVPISGVSMPHAFQPKIQDQMIAREIVINDAESSIRYKLTKRQTQEEIQECTGAVVITRGKYLAPNTLPDGEKPLYLHISSGAHLKDMDERIIAVDGAAAMVEEILKQGYNSQAVSSTFPTTVNNVVKVNQALSTTVCLGFNADPSVNIAARIRGPNDQYINHIMNETGAAVLLRGCGAGNADEHGEEGQQPLHLYLSSNSPKCLEDARRLAENLLDTIGVEFSASRVSSLKIYNAVPPPQQLLASIQSPGDEHKVKSTCMTSTNVAFSPAAPVLPGQSLPNMNHFPHTSLSGGTSYNGYGGIYPETTPFQQVALALRQSPGFGSSVSSGTSLVSTVPRFGDSSVFEKETHTPRRRKFQELPAAGNGPSIPHQALESTLDMDVRCVSTMSTPKKPVQPLSRGMPPPPSRTMPPPRPRKMPLPPPSPIQSPKVQQTSEIKILPKSDTVSDTLIKLMEYGDDDDDEPEETSEEDLRSKLSAGAAPKPFWAL